MDSLKDWNKVSEKTPEENKTVWCYSEITKQVFLGMFIYLFNEGWFWVASNGIIYLDNNEIQTECELEDVSVTHWFPTPKI